MSTSVGEQRMSVSAKVMRLVNPSTGLMECRVCGQRHFAQVKNGKYRRGSWQCVNRCERKPEKQEAAK